MKLGYILGQKREDKRSKSFAVSISLQTKASGISLETQGVENSPQIAGNLAEVV